MKYFKMIRLSHLYGISKINDNIYRSVNSLIQKMREVRERRIKSNSLSINT